MLLVLIPVSCLTGNGCASGVICETIALPNLFHPGHIDDQRAKMRQFDPFTSTGPGPDIPTDRPEGFAVPGASERRFEGYPKAATGFP
ncbi:MAG TPA: hypothetical protein DEB39_07655 [Planctomycetaceae bacterium]|nr:hypothetical protein [Planctomycetaceae bacterium]